MAECPIKNCIWRGKRTGLPIHLARKHGLRQIHPEIETEPETKTDSYDSIFESKVCPVPGCEVAVPDLPKHLSDCHDEWRLSNGRFVFEV